jgi:anhydro-N-acetylmuramic acid kinase
MRVAGIMSGTSLDGIDVAIVDISAQGIKTVAHRTTPYSKATRARILGAATPREVSRLNFELGRLYAEAVVDTCRLRAVPIRSVELVGCHGQTIYHEGTNTLQIGEAAIIAERLGKPVISDFRTRDIAAGGKGAPLVPFVDELLFRSPGIARVALNIGGIANITVLSEAPVTAFDTGPGNMVVDQLLERMTGGRLTYDRDGAVASRGRVNEALLRSLLIEPYYRAKPPKTAGREQYGAEFVDRIIASRLGWEDLVATATAFTAATVAIGIELFAPATREVIVSGGGVHNPQLMGQIAAFLPRARITVSQEFGVDPDAKEAIAFAILAFRTWRRETGNLPGATGARRAVVLGKITP